MAFTAVRLTGKRPPLYVIEDAPRSTLRDADNPHLASIDVDPGGRTSIDVTY